jgi:hypothetical protein
MASGCATTLAATVAPTSARISPADTRVAASALVRSEDLPIGWSLVSAHTDTFAQIRSFSGCHATSLIDHVTGFAQDELELDRGPNGGVKGSVEDLVEGASSQVYASQLHDVVRTTQFQTCFEAEVTPEYLPDRPIPTVRWSSTASPLPLGIGANVIAMRYHFGWPARFGEPETYTDMVDVVDGRFRASAQLSSDKQDVLTSLDVQLVHAITARLHAAVTAGAEVSKLPVALPPPPVVNYVKNFNPPLSSTFFKETPRQGGSNEHPITWTTERDADSTLTPVPGGVTVTSDLSGRDLFRVVPVSQGFEFSQLDADVTQTGGAGDGWVGLTCSVTNDFVAFMINDTGDWQIDRYISAGEHRVFLLGGHDPSIRPLNADNHVTIGCTSDGRNANQMAFGVNGNLLAVFDAKLTDHLWLPGVYVYNQTAPSTTAFRNIVQSGT